MSSPAHKAYKLIKIEIDCGGNQTKTLAKSVEAVMTNLHTEIRNACEIIGTTVEEYERAKK